MTSRPFSGHKISLTDESVAERDPHRLKKIQLPTVFSSEQWNRAAVAGFAAPGWQGAGSDGPGRPDRSLCPDR